MSEAIKKVDAAVSAAISRVNKDMVMGVVVTLMIAYHASEMVGYAKNFLKHDEAE